MIVIKLIRTSIANTVNEGKESFIVSFAVHFTYTCVDTSVINRSFI